MAKLFRPKIVRYLSRDGKRVPKGTDGARRVEERGDRWYGQYRDANDVWKRVPLSTDKTAAEFMLCELKRKAERERAGCTDPFEGHRRRPLAEHLADYKIHLSAKGNTAKHVSLQSGRIEAICEACGFRRISDVSASAVAANLAEARRSGEIGVATSNHRQAAAKAFTRWLVRDRRAPDDALAHLSAMNAKLDVRRERRTLDPAEFVALIEAARRG
ncbi:MAG TPA: hypothetical protein VMV69_01630, partial [Pirellulales bacterium]|nr:hypothetical protein [Pirellulales bacterium]